MSSIALFLVAFTVLHAIDAQGVCEIEAKSDIPGITYYDVRPKNDLQPHRQVVILPPTGGKNRADRALAKGLCQRGHFVRILDYSQGSGHTTNLGIHDELSRVFLSTLDTLLRNEERETVLVGASLGGMYASVAYGLGLRDDVNYPSLKKLNGIVITVAGGTLADVLATSELDSVRAQRELRFDSYGFKSAESYRDALLPAITLDPLHLAIPEAKKTVLMFNSTSDPSVPAVTQEALWRAWGSPAIERFGTGHTLTVGRVYFFHKETISQFILALPPKN